MTATIQPGQIIGGRWRIDRFLASGGFGQVFAATDVSTAAIGSAAVKVLLSGSSTAERQAFLDEAKHMSALHHPNLAAHMDSGHLPDGDGAVFLVTDLCEESLEDFRRRKESSTLLESELPPILADISAGLVYLHRSGRIHRDLKPANILRAGDRWKLADFGLVRDLSRSGVYHLQSLVGSPRYMAPEFFADGLVGPGSDIWAVGVIVHELLTGRGPFAGEGAAYIHAVTNEDPKIDPSLSPAAADTIGRCLRRDPAERPAAAELPALFEGLTPSAEAAGGSILDKTISVPPPGEAPGPGSDGQTRVVSPPTDPAPNQGAADGQPVAGVAAVAAAGSFAAADGPKPSGAGQSGSPPLVANATEQVGGNRRWWLAATAVVLLGLVGFGLYAMLGDDTTGDDTTASGLLDPAGPDTGTDTESGAADNDPQDAASDDGAGGTADDADSENADRPTEEDAEAASGDEEGAGSETRSGVALDEFSAGDCADIDDIDRFVIDTVVPCEGPHQFEVIAMFEAPQAGGEYPGSGELVNTSAVLCPEAFQDRYGVDQAGTSLGIIGMAPTAEDWANQTYQLACVVYRSDFSPLTEPITDIDQWQWKPGDTLAVIQLQPGFCFDAPVELVEGFQQRVVIADCAGPHGGEHYTNVLLTPVEGEGAQDAYADEADGLCHDQLHATFGDDHNQAGFTSRSILDSATNYQGVAAPLALCVVEFPEPTEGSLADLYEMR